MGLYSATCINPRIADAILPRLTTGMFGFREAFLQGGCIQVGEVLKSDLPLSPGVRQYGVGWHLDTHKLLESHVFRVDEPHL